MDWFFGPKKSYFGGCKSGRKSKKKIKFSNFQKKEYFGG
jgi:hypothetical protein